MPDITKLELLSPAQNLRLGMTAINYGADAVYIGGPRFGAREAAGNPVSDIERLCRHAHLYGARVYITLNTILFDHELEEARGIIFDVYRAGADALIIQDMGILEMDLPPIAIHASTQANNYSLDRIKFLDAAGVKRIVLARELSLREISVVRDNTGCELEAFVYGALCVSLSGQCYMSYVSGGRSANRGCCAQPCRNLYSLKDSRGKIILKDRHLLSLKDMDRRAFLPELLKAGVTSFKIEGRLKDENYVKNITACFRKALDREIEKNRSFSRASSGHTTLLFRPDPEKTFHRGSTDYLLTGKRGAMSLPETSKSTGKPAGTVIQTGKGHIQIKAKAALHNNDGLVFFDKEGTLRGLKVNRVKGDMISFAKAPVLPVEGAAVYRNYDHEFLKELEKDRSVRKIKVTLQISFKRDDRLLVRAVDEDKITVENEYSQAFIPARSEQTAAESIQRHLSKSGATPFYIDRVTIKWGSPVFMPSALLNKYRHEILQKLELERLNFFKPVPFKFPGLDATFPYDRLDFSFNVSNKLARRFYQRHGVRQIDKALEVSMPPGEIVVMTTKHCLRYELGFCAKDQPAAGRERLDEPLFLYNRDGIYQLRFDCRECFMYVVRLPLVSE
jgi:collagenase-like PrtC family protease